MSLKLNLIVFLKNSFKYKKNSKHLLKKFKELDKGAEQMPSKVLFVGKETRRPFGHCALKL